MSSINSKFKHQVQLLTVVWIFVLICNESKADCATEKNVESICSEYCYNIVKPLLQHVKYAKEKELRFNELLAKIQEQDSLINEMKIEQLVLKTKLDHQDALLNSKQNELKLCELNNVTHELLLAYRAQIENPTEKLDSQDKIKEKDIEISAMTASHSKKTYVNNCIKKGEGMQIVTTYDVKEFPVSCDSILEDPGWIVIQRRTESTANFNRSWDEYRLGFGEPEGSFFIGLEKLHLLTNANPHDLHIYLRNLKNETRFAQYDHFEISDESEFYKITVGNYSGSAGDSLGHHNKMKFSTHDKDNDESKYNCADHWLSGWWYKACYVSNLNGVYQDDVYNFENGIKWNSWESDDRLTFVQMMIRPKAHSH